MTPAKEAAIRARVKPGAAIRDYFRKYQHEADQRGLFFDLTFDQFSTLLAGDCAYCGQPPKLTQTTKYRAHSKNGIDRADNNIGYIASNCVSCCPSCNFMKRSMGVREFLERVAQIYFYSSSVTRARA